MVLNEIGWESLDLTDVAQNKDQFFRAVVKAVMNLRIP
jgi:hypothetical protein